MRNKKYWLIGLFSVAILGGGVITYTMYSQPPQTSKQTATVKKKKKVKKDSDFWLLPETKKEATKKEEKEQHADVILGVILGETPKEKKEDSGFFGLLGQLASAIGLQDDKEKDRENVAEAAEKDKPVKDPVLPLPTPTIPIPDLPVIVPPAIITPDPQPIAPPPDPQPNRPTLDELIQQARGNLNLARVKSEFLTTKLNSIQKDLEKLDTVKAETNLTAVKASAQWVKVKALVAEYNTLSAELKQLIGTDGTIAKENSQLYNDTYTKLTEKVSELKEAQGKAKNTTTGMNNTVKEADNVLNSLQKKHEEYQKTQKQVTNATANAQTAVTQAQENPDVATAVQPEIDQVNQSTNDLNTKNQEVGQKLDTASSPETQANVDNAKQKVETVNNLAEEQNQAANDAIDDFNSLPTPQKEDPEPAPDPQPEQPSETLQEPTATE